MVLTRQRSCVSTDGFSACYSRTFAMGFHSSKSRVIFVRQEPSRFAVVFYRGDLFVQKTIFILFCFLSVHTWPTFKVNQKDLIAAKYNRIIQETLNFSRHGKIFITGLHRQTTWIGIATAYTLYATMPSFKLKYLSILHCSSKSNGSNIYEFEWLIISDLFWMLWDSKLSTYFVPNLANSKRNSNLVKLFRGINFLDGHSLARVCQYIRHEVWPEY